MLPFNGQSANLPPGVVDRLWVNCISQCLGSREVGPNVVVSSFFENDPELMTQFCCTPDELSGGGVVGGCGVVMWEENTL